MADDPASPLVALTIAQRIFDGGDAQNDLDDLIEQHHIPHEKVGWDWYDSSVELYGVPPDYRLHEDAVTALLAAGFMKIYVNHTDFWETHYSARREDGWRVSYPHKRKDDDPAILVEAAVPDWPREWFDTGYSKVVEIK